MKAAIITIGAIRLTAGLAVKSALLIWLLSLGISPKLLAQSNMLYLEAQVAGSYNTAEDAANWYSHHPHELMQKPSLGFDFLSRLGSQSKDFAYISVQGRLAYDESVTNRVQAQLYNAFVNLKLDSFDAWLGHNKPAIGLSYSLDNHALLLRDLSMSGLNFDRDWGAGIQLSGAKPSLAISATTGSGMPLHIKDTYLLAGRTGWGDLAEDSYSVGISASGGRVLRTMGYDIMHNKLPHDLLSAGMDFSLTYLDWYMYTDLLYGTFHDNPAHAGLLRLGRYLLPEERLSIEAQAYTAELATLKSQEYTLGLTGRISADFSLRAMYSYLQPEGEHLLALQVYYLKGFAF